MWWSKSKIEFMCSEDDFGAIARPTPAGKVIPGWYKALSPADQGQGVYTMKRCVPLLEAMSTGWILSAPVDITFNVSSDRVDTLSHYPKQLVSSHAAVQVKGSPWEHRVVLKIDTLWSAKTSPGWSCLYTRPLNRVSPDIEPFSGVVDTDTFHQNIVVPLYTPHREGTFTLEKGTPLVQVIPFRRERLASDIRVPTKSEGAAMRVQYNAVLSQAGWYRKFIWGARK
jgi:hypothetical protein